MLSYESLHKNTLKTGVGSGQRYPKFLKGLAQFLYKEKGLERMQVQCMIQLVTGICINKETLKGWIYKESEQIE